jgi:hypothetical protein
MVPPEEKKNLGLKGELLGILIKINEEGILIHILKQSLAVQSFCEHSGKARLTDPKGSFDGNVLVHPDAVRILRQGKRSVTRLICKTYILFQRMALVKKRGNTQIHHQTLD